MITRTNLNNIQETGRLGNQLWAIASAIGIAKKNGMPFYFPEWRYQKWFSNELPHGDFSYYTPNRLKVYEEKSPYYEDIKLDPSYGWDLKGYFQSYKYFEDYRHILWHYLRSFSYREAEKYSGCIGIHVRRGDYLNLQNIHPVLGMDYYLGALKFLGDRVGYKFKKVIFTDDPQWCKENFWDLHGITYKLANEIDIVDFIGFNSCEHFIIANSSFSWWAAYLNYSPANLVIAPKTWVFNEDRDERIPKEWIRF